MKIDFYGDVMKKIIRKCSFFYLCLFGFALFSSCGTTNEVSDSKSVEIKIDDAEIIDYDNSVEDVDCIVLFLYFQDRQVFLLLSMPHSSCSL